MKKMLLNFLIFTAAVLATQAVFCMSESTKTDYSILSKKLQDDIEQTTKAFFDRQKQQAISNKNREVQLKRPHLNPAQKEIMEKEFLPTFRMINSLNSDAKLYFLKKIDLDTLFELDELLESLSQKYDSGNSDLVLQSIFQDSQGLDTLGAIQEAARAKVAQKLGLTEKALIAESPDKDYIKRLKKINFEEKLPGIFPTIVHQLPQKLPSLLEANPISYGQYTLSLPGHNNNVFSISLNPKRRTVTINVNNIGIDMADILDLNEFPTAHILSLEDNPKLPKHAQDGLLKLTATFAALLGMESLTFNSMFINKNNNKIKMLQDAGFKETAPGTLSLNLTELE